MFYSYDLNEDTGGVTTNKGVMGHEQAIIFRNLIIIIIITDICKKIFYTVQNIITQN